MDLVIIGAGGHGRVVLDILQSAGKHHVVGFLDANASLAGKTVGGVPVLGQINLLPRLKGQKVRGAVVAIGDNPTRLSYAKTLQEQGLELPGAIHPSAVIARSAKMGPNVVVAAGAVIGPETQLGPSVIINHGALVDHECVIEEGVHVCPGAAVAGRVRIGPSAFIGLGSRIIQCLSIGSSAIVGAGAVVISDVPDDATVVGVPARVIKTQSGLRPEICAV
jgi:sugar O-acyltransferase (sialic acid O-acetyltransferase NeuD family)